MTPFQLDFKPSRILTSLLVGMTVGAMVIVALLHLPWQLKLLGFIVLLISVGWAIATHGLVLLPRACRSLSVNHLHEAHLTLRDGTRYQLQILPHSVVTPYLIVVQARMTPRKWYRKSIAIVLLPDTAPAEQLRKLRVWLRWGNHPAQQDTAPT